MIEDYQNKDGFDMDGYREAFSAYSKAERIAKFEKSIIEDYGIDTVTWANTPDKIKVILSDLHQDAESHAETMYAIEEWASTMPI